MPLLRSKNMMLEKQIKRKEKKKSRNGEWGSFF